MTRLAIFGDSFVDSVWKKQRYQWSWPNRLAQDYHTFNAGLIGTGPDYALDHLLQYIEYTPNDQLAETCVIFVCSDTYRLNLKNFWNQDWDQVNIIRVADRSQPHPKYMFVKDLFRHLMTPSWNNQENFKMICSVNNLSHLFKQVLYWPTNTPYAVYSQMFTAQHNFTQVESCLFDLSMSNNPARTNLDDNRVNHFDPAVHDAIYHAVVQWISTQQFDITTVVDLVSNA